MKRSVDFTLCWLLGSALLLKLGYLFFGLPDASSPAVLSIDALYHYKWASLIASGDLFANAPYFRAPLYPFFLAGSLKISGHSLILVRLIQLLLGCLTLFFIYRLARNLFGKGAAVIAFAVYLLYPLTTYFEGELLLDSLFTLLALMSLYYLTSRITESRIGLPAAAILFGLAAATRPTILVFLPVVLIYLWRRKIGAAGTGVRLRAAALFVGLVFLAIAPVTLINYIHSGRFILISYQGGVNFYIGNNAEADGLTASLPPVGQDWDITDADQLALAETGKRLRYDAQSRYWYRKGVEYILSDPVGFAGLLGKKLHFLFSGHEVSNNRPLEEAVFGNGYLRRFPVRISIIFALAILPLFLTTENRRAILSLYGMIFLYGLIVSLFFVTSRFRLPLVPLAVILAGGGIWTAFEMVRRRRFGFHLVWAGLAAVGLFFIGQINAHGISLVNPRQALFLRGNIALRQADYQTAAARFDSLTRMSPYYDNAFLNLGIAKLKLGQVDSAVMAFRCELDRSAGSAEALNNLAVVYLLRQEYDSANVYCRQALDIKPYYEEAAINLLRSARGHRDSPLADRLEDQRRRSRPFLSDSPSYLFEEGLYFTARGRYREAIDNHLHLLDLIGKTRTPVSFAPVFSRQSTLDRTSLPTLANYQLGYLFGLTGNFSESIRFSRQAIELNGNMKEAYVNLISGYRSLGDTRSADSLIEVYRSRWPDDF